MNNFLDHDISNRLSGDYHELLESLGELGGFYLQARNRSGGLGKVVRQFSPIIVEGENKAFDPDSGIEISTGSIVAVHAGLAGCEPAGVPALDFEFREFPAGLSFHEFPDISQPDAIAKITRLFYGQRIPSDQITEWRKEFSPCRDMCPCCETRAASRVNNVNSHPLFSIFEDAKTRQVSLEFRLLSEHVDLTSGFIPETLASGDGFIILTGHGADSAAHIDMRFLHAMAIDIEEMDGTTYSSLRLFDMYGNLNFQIMSNDPTDAIIWRETCEASRRAQ